MITGYAHFVQLAESLQWDEKSLDYSADRKAWPTLEDAERDKVLGLVAGFCIAETSVAGQLGSLGSGRIALLAIARTLPGVSCPSRVVRSTIRIARSRANSLAVVLMDRVPRAAARASAPTWSTPGSPCRKRRRDASDWVTSEKSQAGP